MKRIVLYILALVVLIMGGFAGYGWWQDHQLPTYQHVDETLVANQTIYHLERVVTISEVDLGDKIAKTSDDDLVYAVKNDSKKIVVQGSGGMSPLFLYSQTN